MGWCICWAVDAVADMNGSHATTRRSPGYAQSARAPTGIGPFKNDGRKVNGSTGVVLAVLP